MALRNRVDQHLDSTGHRLCFKELVVPGCAYDEHTIQYAYDALAWLLEARCNPGLNTSAREVRL